MKLIQLIAIGKKEISDDGVKIRKPITTINNGKAKKVNINNSNIG